MVQWNPHSPDAVGLEWLPTTEGQGPLNGPLITGTALLRPTDDGAEISKLHIYVGDRIGWGEWEMEVYDLTELGPAALPTDTVFYPTVDEANTNCWPNNGSTQPQVDLWSYIDEPDPADATNWIGPVLGYGAVYGFRAGGIAGAVTDRITAVRVDARVQVPTSSATRTGGEVVPYLKMAGRVFFGPGTTISGSNPLGFVVSATWLFNPATGVSWKPEDLAAFDDTDVTDSCAGWQFNPTGDGTNQIELMQGNLVVTTDGTDRRIAYGTVQATVSSGWFFTNGWLEIPMATPAGDSFFVLDDTITYAFVLRMRSGNGYIAWRYLEVIPFLRSKTGLVENIEGPPNWSSCHVNISTRRQVPTTIDSYGSGAFSIILERSDTTLSPDSQPYAANLYGFGTDSRFGLAEPDLDYNLVHTGRTAGEQFTVPVTGDYGFVRLPAAWATGNEPAGPLELELWDVTGTPVQVGSTISIAALDLAAPRTGYRIVEAAMDTPATLTAGNDYQLRCSSTALAAAGWLVQAASVIDAQTYNPPPTGTDDLTWGGAAARYVGTLGDFPGVDLEFTLHTTPDAPADFTAESVANGTCLENAVLAWTPTALGADFAQYDIERWNDEDNPDGDPYGWQSVATVLSEATATWTDQEPYRGDDSLTEYRIRVRRADHSPSLWAEASVTVAACCGLVFSSNQRPELELWSDYDAEPVATWDIIINEKAQQFYGRDYQVTFRETENRGDRMLVKLLIAADGGIGDLLPASPRGRHAFDRFVTLFKAPVTYVCVTDQDGLRYFASVSMGQATREEPGGIYELPVKILQSTQVPTVVVIP